MKRIWHELMKLVFMFFMVLLQSRIPNFVAYINEQLNGILKSIRTCIKDILWNIHMDYKAPLSFQTSIKYLRKALMGDIVSCNSKRTSLYTSRWMKLWNWVSPRQDYRISLAIYMKDTSSLVLGFLIKALHTGQRWFYHPSWFCFRIS